MTKLEWIAQIIGIVAMGIIILSYQQKKQSTVIAFQLFGSALFAINFFMLGAIMGGLLNFIAIIRAIVFLNKKKLNSNNIWWTIAFECIYLISYALTFTVFEKPFNLTNIIVEILPIIGMTATTLAYRHEDSSKTRKYGLINSPLWLIYNFINFSVGAIIGEVLSLVSIILGIIRLDLKKEKGEISNE